MAHLSKVIRTQQYDLFLRLIKPKSTTPLLDVGLTPNEELVDSNFFEQIYPYPKSLTGVSVENCLKIAKKYGLRKFLQVDPTQPYPFRKKEFECVVSWATLEHVGSEKQQRVFLSELDRVGKKVFLTTPYKYSPYELHTELFFVHWLPDHLFRLILKKFGKHFWAEEQNLRLLGMRDVRKILPSDAYTVRLFYSFGILPTHLLIYKA